MELMLFNGQGSHHRIRLDLYHVVLELGDLAPGELAPVDVGLSVVVDEDGGVDAPHPLELPHIREGTRGRLGLGHTAPPVRNAVVEVVPTVAVGAVGSVEGTAVLRPGGIGQGEDHTVIGPMDQILRGVDAVDVAAIGLNPLKIEGTVQVQSAVSPCVGLHVGDEKVTLQEGIMRVIKRHSDCLPFSFCASAEEHSSSALFHG